MGARAAAVASLSPRECACGCGELASVDKWRGVAREYVPGHNARVAPARAALTHGMFGTPTYKAWAAMKDRCLNERSRSYPDYGGRGITVCDRWRTSFEAFLADMGERPEGLSLDRRDNDGSYEPGNCRWATPKQQQRNTRRTKLTEADVAAIRGRTGSQRAIAAEFGIDQSTVSQIRSGKRWAPC